LASTARTFISKASARCDLLPDLAVPDDPDRPAGDLQHVRDRLLARPASGGLVLLEAVQPARERQQHCERVLGDDAGMGAARVGDRDVALDDLRDRAQHLDAGARDLDPLELLRGLELLECRPAVHHLGIHDLAADRLGRRRPHLLNVGEIVKQIEIRIARPRRQQQLHRYNPPQWREHRTR
jgi:hypothetical protein